MRRDVPRSILADPTYRRAVSNAWDALQKHRELPDDVRADVGTSWLRCLEARVDPSLKQSPSQLGDDALEELRSRQAEMIVSSQETLLTARELLRDTGSAMMLTDERGSILSIEGDRQTLRTLENLLMVPGATWSEQACGTNAIGTALSLGKPIEIHGAEHFCESIKRFTCSAAVLRNPSDGEVIGALNVSGLESSYAPQTLALVINAAQRINALIEIRHLRTRARLLEVFDERALRGVVLLDCSDIVVKSDSLARLALQSRGQQTDILGRRATIRSGDPDDQSGLFIDPEWVEPLFDGNRQIGSVVFVPRSGMNSRIKNDLQDATSSDARRAFSNAKGQSPEFHRAVLKAVKISKSSAPVLLLGETGVGKEVFSTGIHAAGSQPDGPFIALNCGAFSKELLASELFGYADGAFTGARKGGVRGKIEAANGGTLFLDEIGEMPLDLQPNLLRVLETQEVVRLGDAKPVKVKFRLISATNRDLRDEVAQGRFRRDLYYRLSVININIPPLRDRIGDVQILSEHFLELLSERHGIPKVGISSAAMQLLESHLWPGNIRELRNVLESLVLSMDGDQIELEDVQFELAGPRQDQASSLAAAGSGELAQSEFEHIKRVLQTTSGNATLAAKRLGIAKSTLYLKIHKYGLDSHLDRQRDRKNH